MRLEEGKAVHFIRRDCATLLHKEILMNMQELNLYKLLFCYVIQFFSLDIGPKNELGALRISHGAEKIVSGGNRTCYGAKKSLDSCEACAHKLQRAAFESMICVALECQF